MSLDVTLSMVCPVGCCPNQEVFEYNCTHNLNMMAGAAGIYEVLWRPDEIGFFKAYQVAEKLVPALKDLKANKKKYEKFNPENGWGSYDGFVKFVEEYLAACEKNPYAIVSVSR
jgi:hypothetical protein